MKYELVLFDLDGTVIDSGEGIFACVRYVFSKMGRTDVPEELVRSFIGPPLCYQFEKAGKMSHEDAVKAVAIYRERYSNIGIFESELYPGIRDSFECLKDNNIKIALASAKPQRYVNVLMKHFDIEKYFDVIEGAQADNERPDKFDIVNRTLEKAGYSDEKDKVVFVGDRKYDAMGARLCGIDFIGAGWGGYTLPGEFEAEGVKYIADTPEIFSKMVLR